MNKKVYNTILFFTGFVLLGIVILQIFWLNNMSIIRREELVSNTQQALTKTVDRIEKDEQVDMVLGHMGDLLPDSMFVEPLGKLKVVLNDLDSFETINFSNEYIKGVTVIKHDEGEVKNIPHEITSHRRTITYAPSTPGKIENKVKDIDSIVQQMVIEMDFENVSNRLHTDTLHSILKDELHKRGIDIAFEYAILRDDSTIFKSDKFIPSSIAMTFETKLFPGDIFDKNVKLIIYYPVSSSNGYIFSKMKTFLILTGIFTLGILIAFYLTIRTMNRQKRLSEMKNDFINNITHEFKTPIATSSIAIAALENNQVRTDADKFGYYTGILKEENVKMNLQVEKVLQMAMMEKGKIEIELQEVNVHDILQESLKGFDLLFKENKVALYTSLQAERFTVKADPFHLKHVFNNIIDNAIKYKNTECRLNITTETKNNELLISFKDNGPGMNTEIQKHAFEKFYRGQKGDLHEVKGFGLGLSYAKNIVELSKGKILLNSSPGKGTEVVISLPLV